MEKKFILTDKFVINSFGIKLFQIKCTKSFKYAQKGDFGGYVEKEGNLDQENDARVSSNARVFGNARVSSNARVSGDAWVSDNAWVSSNAWVSGDALVSGYAWVSGDARVFGNARVSGDAWVSGNAWVSGDADIENDNEHCGFDGFGSCNRHTHAYMTKEKKVEIICGCFRGSIEEFEKKVEETHSGTVYEKQYKSIINVIKIKFGLTDFT